MKQIFTLLSMGVLCLASKNSFAQSTPIDEKFNSTNVLNTLTSNCWKLNNIVLTTGTSQQPPQIEGTSSIYVKGAVTGFIATPFYDFVATTPLSISFSFQLDNKLSNNATRIIEVGTLDKTDAFTSLGLSITLDKNSNTTLQTYSTVINPSGTFRLAVQIKGLGDGNSSIIMDQLSIKPSSSTATMPPFHYGSSPCNTAPTATNNSYNQIPGKPTTGNFLTDGTPDSDLNNGETITFVSVTQPTQGTVVMNANNSFTFTPTDPLFEGNVTFNYTIIDKGYDPLTATGTVNIIYAQNTVLPIHLKSLSGNVNNSKAQLSWNVADNETGSYFEIQKSVDGKKFENAAMLFTTAKVGDETYTYSEATTLKEGAFYRLRVVNKDNSVSYSKVIYLKALDATDTNKIMLLQNPVQSTLSFAFTTAVSEPTEIAVYNMAGVKVYSQKTMAQKGTNTINTDCNNKLTTGNYILQVSSASNNATTKIVKY